MTDAAEGEPVSAKRQPVPDTHLGYTIPLDTTGRRAAWLSLPRDLTPAEAARLGRFVASLAVPEEAPDARS